MNSIFPLLPVVEPVVGDAGEGSGLIGPDRRMLDEEPLPEGVALLLAALLPLPGMERRPVAPSEALAGQYIHPGDGHDAAKATERGDSTRRIVEAAKVVDRDDGFVSITHAPKTADTPTLPKSAGLAGGHLSSAQSGTAAAEVLPHDGLNARIQAAAVEERLPVASQEGPMLPAEAELEEPIRQGASEFSPGGLQARSEVPVPLAQMFSAGTADEPAVMSEQHEQASSQRQEQDEEASGDFLQVPFSNQYAQGQVLVSRDETGHSGLLIRASDRRVFEQLRRHLDQVAQERWRLGDEGADDEVRIQ